MHGGSFRESLTKSCTHLVAATTTSIKYKTAVKWGIKVVNQDWIAECVKAQRRVDELLFPVKIANQVSSHAWDSEDISESECAALKSESADSMSEDIAKNMKDDLPQLVDMICEECYGTEEIVVCGGCGKGWHLTCMRNPLAFVPPYPLKWYCHNKVCQLIARGDENVVAECIGWSNFWWTDILQ